STTRLPPSRPRGAGGSTASAFPTPSSRRCTRTTPSACWGGRRERGPAARGRPRGGRPELPGGPCGGAAGDPARVRGRDLVEGGAHRLGAGEVRDRLPRALGPDRALRALRRARPRSLVHHDPEGRASLGGGGGRGLPRPRP